MATPRKKKSIIIDVQHEEVPANTPTTETHELFPGEPKKDPEVTPASLVTQSAATALFAKSAQGLAEIQKVLDLEIAGIDDKENYDKVYAAHQITKKTLTYIESTRLEANRNSKAVIDGTAAQLDKDWRAANDKLAAKRKPIDDELERIKNEKAKAHKDMVDARMADLERFGFVFSLLTREYVFEFGATRLTATNDQINTLKEEDWARFAMIAEQRAADKVAFDTEKANALKLANDRAAKAEQEADTLRAQLAALQNPKPFVEVYVDPWPDPKGDGKYPAAATAGFVRQDRSPLGTGPDQVIEVIGVGATESQKADEETEEQSEEYNQITVRLSTDDIEYLQTLIDDEAATDYSEAINYTIVSCRDIEKLYGKDAYDVSDNDVRKPYIDALKQIHEGKAPGGKAFKEWARGIAQTVLQPQS